MNKICYLKGHCYDESAARHGVLHCRTWDLELKDYFPESGEVTNLTGISVTSMGIEFDLPRLS